jgi:hypothetical protein
MGQTVSVPWMNYLHLGEGRDRLIQKMLSNEEQLIVLRRQIHFDRDQKAAAIECLATSAVAPPHYQRNSLWYQKKLHTTLSLLQCTEDVGEGHVGCSQPRSNNPVYSHNHIHGSDITSDVNSVFTTSRLLRVHHTTEADSRWDILVHDNSQYGSAA